MDRRRFLTSAALGGVSAAVVGCSGDDTEAAAERSEGGIAAGSYLPFRGDHQVGITAAGQTTGLMAAFDVVADDRGELEDLLAGLTVEIERVMSGTPYEEREPAYPALYTGTVGNPPPPVDLSAVVAVGSSLFDERYGLADRKPAELAPMGILANDRLDPRRTHGDLLVSIASTHEDVDIFALRQLMRATRGGMTLRWTTDGYLRRTKARPGEAGVRNLMGFVDGTANLDPDDRTQMEEFVWVAEGDAEPAWTVGGSYQAVRIIRMLVEFWDRTRLSEQERLIGRRKSDGAPLDGERETDEPDFAADPDGALTPLESHIRLARPRTPETEHQRFLRRGFNYSRGFDDAGQLDQGLAFVSFQRSLNRQFLPVIARLDGEGLEEYIVPEGGGFFFALPGVARGEHLGTRLLA
ncbi:MAG: Dyp-type peroxidase [Ilumatobacteraceae bacterium]